LVAVLLAGCPSQTLRRGGAPEVPSPRSLPESAAAAPAPAAGVADALDPTGAVLPGRVEYDQGFVLLSYAQALRLAADRDAPLLVYLFTKWCGPCKELDEKVFPEQEFQTFAKTIVSLKVDALSDEGTLVAKRFGVDSYPTMIVCRSDGTEIERFFGFSPTQEFIGTVRDYIAGRNTASWLRDRAEEDPTNMEAAFVAGRELAIRDRGEEAEPFLKAVIAGAGAGPAENVPRAMLLLGRTVYLDQMHDHAKAVPVLEELSGKYPDTFFGVEATYDIARIFIEQQQVDKAREVLTNRITFAGKDQIERFRYASFCLLHSFMLPEATIAVRDGLKERPDAAYLWKTLADLEFRQKNYDAAAEAMQKAAELEPETEAYSVLLQTYRTAAEKARGQDK